MGSTYITRLETPQEWRRTRDWSNNLWNSTEEKLCVSPQRPHLRHALPFSIRCLCSKRPQGCVLWCYRIFKSSDGITAESPAPAPSLVLPSFLIRFLLIIHTITSPPQPPPTTYLPFTCPAHPTCTYACRHFIPLPSLSHSLTHLVIFIITITTLSHLMLR